MSSAVVSDLGPLTAGRRGRREAAADARPLGGDWPNTTRPLPWLIAGFLAMVWLTPFESVNLPISLPFDSHLDRLALGILVVAWIGAIAVGAERGPRLRPSAVDLGVVAFMGVVVLGVLANAEVLSNLGQMTLAFKKLVLISTYLIFFYICATSIRRSELRAFTALLIGLACVTAIGLIYEYRTGVNLFYDWTATILPDTVAVDPPPVNEGGGRPTIVGPTTHGLAAAALFAMALPFAVAGALASPGNRRRVVHLAAAGLMIAAALCTLRKTGAVAPCVALLVLLLYKPKQMIRLLPAGLVLLVAVQMVAPGAINRVRIQLAGTQESQSSTAGRTSDYEAVWPDIMSEPALGRGFGTYDSSKYRILDNEYLGVLVETGAVGLAAFAAMILSVIFVAHRLIRRWEEPVAARTALAAAAATAAFGVATALFDVLSFGHAPYLFFFVAALAVVAAERRPLRPARPAPA
jgi:O-antigen ligase